MAGRGGKDLHTADAEGVVEYSGQPWCCRRTGGGGGKHQEDQAERPEADHAVELGLVGSEQAIRQTASGRYERQWPINGEPR